jgi:hypothetical protein
MRRLVMLSLTVLAVATLTSPARSQQAKPPETLTIGYDDEGKIDATLKGCVTTVKEVTEWDDAQTQKGAREVCAARQKHVEAYKAMQAAYKAFTATITKDNRFDWATAASTIPTLVKTCIEHKSAITTGGHNIYIDIISNQITTACLGLATNLMKAETQDFKSKGL